MSATRQAPFPRHPGGRFGPAFRARILGAGLLGLFLAAGAKTSMIALAGSDAARTAPEAPPPEAARPRRGDITDRNGVVLATSVPAYSLHADPRLIWDPAEHAAKLSQTLPGLDPGVLERRLSDTSRAFVWIKRRLSPRERDAVRALGLEGLAFREEPRRAYPQGAVAAHLLGSVGVDQTGLGGIELAMEGDLGEGRARALTLDAAVQYAVESELDAAARLHRAEGGAAVLLDAQTGDVLALASWPSLGPADLAGATARHPAKLDRSVGAVYELGSVFKPLTVAAALDAGAVSLSDRFDVSAPIEVMGETISDDHALGTDRAGLSAIIGESSNVGTVRVALRLGEAATREWWDRAGLSGRADLRLPASAAPLLPLEWTELTVATVSYGHGVAVSPVAFASAFGALANNGEWRRPRIDPARPPAAPVQAFTPQTARLVAAYLREAVLDGTGRYAEAAGWGVAGKTGTAEKPGPGGYSEDENVTAFAAIFPASAPRYSLLVVLDAPKAAPDARETQRTAGYTAAPLAGRIVSRVAPLLGLTPHFHEAEGGGDAR